jgi:hypothetical protein
MRRFFRAAAAAAAAGLFLAPAAGAVAASAATARPAVGVPVRGGNSTITTSTGIARLLVTRGLDVFATSPGTESLMHGPFALAASRPAVTPAVPDPRLKFMFPVSGGSLNEAALSGSVNLRGGFLIINSNNGQQIQLSRLKVDFGRRIVTGVANGQLPATLFALDLSHITVHHGLTSVRLTGIVLRLTGGAARALNTALGVDVFTGGMKIATATDTIHL